jgi:hypothetical protein
VQQTHNGAAQVQPAGEHQRLKGSKVEAQAEALPLRGLSQANARDSGYGKGVQRKGKCNREKWYPAQNQSSPPADGGMECLKKL